MPWLYGVWRDHSPYKTRQFALEHQRPAFGLPTIFIPDRAVFRIVSKIVRGIGEYGCWSYRDQQSEHSKIWFKDPVGEMQRIKGSRFALLLRDDRAIQPGRTANHTCPHSWCINPRHLYCGTQSQNQLDAVLDGSHAGQPDQDLRASDYDRHRRERAMQRAREVRCQKFFCEEIRAELAVSTPATQERQSTPTAATNPIPLDMSVHLEGLHLSQKMVLMRKPLPALSAS